jgi:hypothetical protein
MQTRPISVLAILISLAACGGRSAPEFVSQRPTPAEVGLGEQGPNPSPNDGAILIDPRLPTPPSPPAGNAPPAPQGPPVTVPPSIVPAPPPGSTVEQPVPSPNQPIAADINIQELALFQAVKISLFRNGESSPVLNAPIVANRQGLLRVYVQLPSDYRPRPLVATLEINRDGVTTTLSVNKTLTRNSTDAQLESTFNFTLSKQLLQEGVQIRVRILEAQAGIAAAPRADVQSEVPGEGAWLPLDAQGAGNKLRIRLIPVRYLADQSGRLPDLSPAQIERYRSRMMSLYPLTDLELSVGEPLDWNQVISGRDGNSYSAILQAMIARRQSDVRQGLVDRNVYYYGAFNPADTFRSFCGGSCITGISPVLTRANDTSQRASVGVGFQGQEDTMVHEIGHALGRNHAPCNNAPGADPSFPYASGTIGVWGLDLLNNRLYDPAQARDFMGYCSPSWISDFNYARLFDRIEEVSQLLGSVTISRVPSPQSYRFLNANGKGRLQWGLALTLDETPSSAETRLATWQDGSGRSLGQIRLPYYRYADQAGGHYMVPKAPRSATRLVLEGVGSVTVPSEP